VQVSRRGFLAGLIALPAVALAAKLSLPSIGMAEEVREELIKDLNKTTVAMPGVTQVWASVSGMSTYWASEIRAKLVDDSRLTKLISSQLDSMTRELARRIDQDLMDAMVPKDKQFVTGIPEATFNKYGQLQLKAGLAKQETIWGDEFRVEYIRPTELILPGLDKRGAAEYGGLIVPAGN
jgi:hypothetical protein